jgi:hypothetical protein
MSHWRNDTARADVMRGTGEDEAAYVAGWTISGLVRLATILVVWGFCDLRAEHNADRRFIETCQLPPLAQPQDGPRCSPLWGRFF